MRYILFLSFFLCLKAYAFSPAGSVVSPVAGSAVPGVSGVADEAESPPILDLTNATYNGNYLDLSGVSVGNWSAPVGNSDGTKIFITNASTKVIYEVDFSTPGDITTASIGNNSGDISLIQSNPQGLAISPSGEKVFIGGFNPDEITQINLSTAEDITSYSDSGAAIDLSAYGNGYGPSNSYLNGTKMIWATYGTPNVLRQIVLTDAEDISTASEDAGETLDLDINPGPGFMSEDGTTYIVPDLLADVLWQYEGTAGELSTFEKTAISFDNATELGDTHSGGVWAYAPPGSDRYTHLYFVGRTTNRLFEIEL